jgi:hypothetical protein
MEPYPTTGPLNPKLTGKMLLMTQCPVACGDIQNEKTSFDSLHDKAEIERQSNFEKL